MATSPLLLDERDQLVLAENDATDIVVLSTLGRSPSAAVREVVAGNRRTPTLVRDILALDPAHRVRLAATLRTRLDELGALEALWGLPSFGGNNERAQASA